MGPTPETQQAHLLSSETQATMSGKLAAGDRRLHQLICSCVCSRCTCIPHNCCRFEISEFQNDMEDMDRISC